MISISRATKADIGALRHLSAIYNHKLSIEEYMFNNRDIAIQARAETGELIGFVWGGLMGNNSLCYVDKVMVHPQYSDQGVLPRLYKELFKIALKRGVKQAFGIIRHDEYHDRSAKAALNMAWGGDALSYTYVYASLEFMKKELTKLGVSNGI